MDKKKVFKNLCLLILKIGIAVFLILTLNLIFIPKYIYENQDGRITGEFYREKKDTDIIFIGSSTVYSGISPLVLWEKYGYTSYDRANASQPMWISYYMIEDAVKCHKPKMVVMDIGFIKYWDTYVEEPSSRKSIDGMRFSKTKLDCIKATIGDDENMTDYLLPIFRFHSRWKELGYEDFLYAYGHKPITYNGFLMDFRKTEKLPDRNGYLLKDNTKIGEKNMYFLIKSIELCQKEDIQLLFIKVPSYSDNWSLDYDEQVSTAAEKYGIHYVNFDKYSEEIGLDYKKHSPDEGNHLNTQGAELFTEYLGEYLGENYDIPSHKDDAAYQKIWNEKLLRYENDKAVGIANNVE